MDGQEVIVLHDPTDFPDDSLRMECKNILHCNWEDWKL